MKALVIGGGIIGLSSAYYLQKDGWQVTLLEKGDLTDNCSFGNMGYISPSHFIPLAAPGMVEQGIFWMFDRKSPFYIRPQLRWDMLRWGLQFIRSSTPAHVERAARPMVDLLLLSKQLFREWAAEHEMEFGLTERGCLMYYQTDKYEKQELETARKAEQLGLQVELLGREQLQTIEPDLRPDVRGGVLFKDDAHVDPNALMQQLPGLLERKGVRILRNTTVTDFGRRDGEIRTVRYSTAGTAASGELEPDLVVLAAGAWSPKLAKLAGDSMLLMPGKGYSMTLERPVKKLHYPCILLEAKVALTPWPGRLRIGSTMEIGSINNRILLSRVQGILEAVPRFFPGIQDDPGFRELADMGQLRNQAREQVWFGFRPVSADGLPYIGFSRNNSNLLLATGHAMLGMSLGPATGKLVAELAGNKSTSVPAAAFDPNRF
ncbi:MAG: FAD-dependent oxidoreductase [Bacteroidetes bacterium]|nr:MAG: FAD-dependent oxidoreductase [Bacteroidota bacterium]